MTLEEAITVFSLTLDEHDMWDGDSGWTDEGIKLANELVDQMGVTTPYDDLIDSERRMVNRASWLWRRMYEKVTGSKIDEPQREY